MEGKREIYFINEGSKFTLSQKLLISYNDSKAPLNFQMICSYCFGILINPINCISCKTNFCKKCIEGTIMSKTIFYCNQHDFHSNEPCVIKALSNSKYFIQEGINLNKINEISYGEIMESTNPNIAFLPSSKVLSEMKYLKLQEITNLEVNLLNLVKNKNNRLSKNLIEKNAKMIKFNYIKGYSLHLYKVQFDINKGRFLKLLNLKKIRLQGCLIEEYFSIFLAQAISYNRKKLKVFSIKPHFIGYLKIKSFMLIFHSLSFCNKLENFHIQMLNINCENYIHENIYNFISVLGNLKFLNFDTTFFYNKMDFNSLNSAQSLKSICFSECKFQIHGFLSLLENILKIKKLETLKLNMSRISESTDLQMRFRMLDILKLNSKLQCLQLESCFFDSSNYDLNSIFIQYLIYKKIVTINSLTLYLQLYRNEFSVSELFQFLNSSQIIDLNLKVSFQINSFLIPGFFKYLENSNSLKMFNLLLYNKNDLRWDLIIKSISLNKSIEYLNISNNNLSLFYANLIELIKANQVISKYNFRCCNLKLDKAFILAICSSKKITHLDISLNKMNDNNVIDILNGSLNHINIYKTVSDAKIIENIYAKLKKWVHKS